MAKAMILSFLAAFAAVANAGPREKQQASRNCQELTVPVSISARNGVFNYKVPTNNVEVTDFILNLAEPGKNYSEALLEGYTTVSGTYSIAATYCEPAAGAGNTLQVLTHGVGFNRSYWDFPTNDYNYSYVDAALARGYSTFAYDRLGLGQSSHGDPLSEIQAFLEIAALRELTTMLRDTALPGVDIHYPKIVHVGHSFGSVHTYALTVMYPSISDGIALTGFSQNLQFGPYFLFAGNAIEANNFSDALKAYPDGYLASGDESAVHTQFFAPGMFDPKVLAAATATQQPATVGELLTISGLTLANNTFAGPVLVITGERDIPDCGGNCYATTPSIPAMVEPYFNHPPSNFTAVVVPGAGHGLNLDYSHPFTYKTIQDFFDANV
ncbi:Alpha/Beta hydrolase protein [Xylariaceae sp. FL0804]|nr:Alpha/Beta hydrolase protein [Xylariaceae sp. FL0804]